MQRRLSSRARAVYIGLMAPLLGVAVFVAFFVSLASPAAQAATSSNLNFQARLLANNGGVVPDGNYNIDFKIYNQDSTTGTVGTCTSHCLWEETYKNFNSQGVKVINGYFSVNLGSITSFPAINWDQPLWLTMNIGGTTSGASPTWDGEMQNSGHSIALTALPYSFVAGQLAKTDGSGNRGTLAFNTVANNPNILLPDASGTVCLQAATACGFESTTGTDFIQNQSASIQTANFNISGTGQIGTAVQVPLVQTADSAAANTTAIVVRSGNETGSSFSSGSVTLKSGDAGGGTNSSSGNIIIDSGSKSGTGTTGSISIGTSNASSVSIGNTTTTSSINFSAGSSGVTVDSTSTTAFQVQNASGTGNLIVADTQNARVGIKSAPCAFFALCVGGDTSISGSITATQNANFGGYYALLKTAGTGGVSANDVVVMDSGTNRVIDTTTPRDQRVFGIAAAAASNGSNQNFVVSGSATVNVDSAAVSIGDQLVTSSTSGRATVDNGATTGIIGYATATKAGGSNGTVTLMVVPVNGQYNPVFRTSSDNTTAFQVQNAAGTSVFNIDTSNSVVGTAATSTASTNSQDFNIRSGNATGSTSNSGNVNIDAGTATGTVGTVSLGNANATTINIAANNLAHTIHIGDGGSSTAQTITIGSATNTSSTTSINGGTGASAIALATGANGGTAGGIVIGNTTGANSQTITIGGNTTASSTSNVNIGSTVAGTVAVKGASTITGRSGDTATTLALTNGNAGQLGLVVTGASGQTADLVQIQDSTGANVQRIDASGDLGISSGYINTAYGGLGAYSNLLQQSEALLTSPWATTGTTTGSASNDATNLAPDGTQHAEKLVSASNGASFDQTSGTAPTNANYTFSVWLKTSSGTAASQLRIDGATTGTGTASAALNVTTSWQRFLVTQNPNGFTGNIKVRIFPGGTGGQATVYAWGAQLVLGSTPQVYVRTVSAVAAATDGLVNNGNATFITAADSTTVFQVQNASGVNVAAVDTSNGQLVLGTAGSSGINGKLVFNTTNASNTSVSIAAASTATSYSLVLPTAGPSLGQCLQNDGSTVGQLTFGPCGVTGTFLSKNATDTSSATAGTGVLYGFTNSSSASTGGVLSLNNGNNTGSTLSATTSGNPAAGKAVIYAQNTNASPSGNLLDLESGSSPTSKFSVDANGNVSLGGASPVTIQGTASNGTLNLAANGTGTLALDTTGAGTITFASANATTITIGSGSVVSTITTQSSGISQTLTGSASAPTDIIKTTTNSAGAFQVQNSSSQKVLSVDTSGNKVLLGQGSAVNGALVFQNSSSNNAITLNSTGAAANYTLTLPSASPAGGLCIETQPGNASQLIFASCSNNNASIQEVNEWDANNSTTVPVSPTTAGDEMVLTTQIPTGGVSISSISGGGVSTWSKIISNAGNGTVNRVEMWAGTVTSTGSSTVTVTYTGGSAGSNEIAVTEFTAAGVNANTSWGIESSSSQLNSTASTTVTYPNMTAVNGSELFYGYAQVQNPPATAGSTTGFSYIQTSTQHNMITYNTSLAANTSYQPTANQNSSGQSNTIAAILTAFVTSSSINNTTSLQKANFYVQAATSGTVAGVLQAASSGSADILDLKNSGAANVFSVSSTGNVLVQPSASATAFQVQNGSNFGVMTVDTSGNQVILGDATHLSGKITFKDSGDSNTISFVAPTSVASSYSLTLPNNTPTAGLCLGTSPSNANQLIFASCATSVSAASISYINKWDNHGTSVTTISDSPASVGNLLVFYSHTANQVNVNSISGGGVTNWTKVNAYSGGGTPGNIEMWRGVVTTTGSGTITVTYSATAGTNEIVAQEFSMGSSSGTWAIDTSGTATTTSSVTTVNYPTLTPLNSSELYTGYAYGGGTMSTGSTSGFTYVVTGGSKYLAYNTNVTGGTAYTPTAPQTSGVYASVAAVIAAYAGTSVIVNSTAVQQANFNVQAATSGTVAGVLQAASSGTADVLQVKDSSGDNVMSVNATAGSTYGLTLGTSNVSGGQLIFNSSGNSNTITIQAPTAPGSSYNLVLPTTTPAAGQCLATSPSNQNQLVFSSCANQVTSIAITFVNNWKSSTVTQSPTLSVSPTNVGDLMTLFINSSKGNTVTSVSGGGVAVWSKIVAANAEEMWRGVVTTSGSATISVSVTTPASPTEELAAQEWTTGSATGSWVIDTSGTISNASSATVTYPSLTPQSTKDLYVGYGVGTSNMSAGSTSGYTYFAGAGSTLFGAYNTSISTTTQPTATQTTAGTSVAAAALIAAYSSSSVISNSTVTQEANFNIQAATSGSVAGVLQAFTTGTGDILDLLDGSGTLVGSVGSTGNLLVKPSTAAAAAFQVQTTGGVNVLSADTSGKQVVVGAGSTGESSVSLLVLDNKTGSSADPSGVNGAMYYNAVTNNFRCYAAGAWQDCGGLLSSNTSQSSANNNCSSGCAAFSTAASIPANYCQAGRVIRLNAHGYFSSQVSATNLQFGVYYGTDNSVASNDTLIGTLTPTVSVTSASNNYFGLDFDVTCFSTTSMQADGLANIQVGAAASGVTGVPISSTSPTTVVSTSTKNLYIFPVWGAASASNTAKITQFIVSSP